MGLFRDETATFKVDVDDGWVEMRRVVRFGDRKYATDTATKEGYTFKPGNRAERRRAAKTGDNTQAHFAPGEYQLCLLERVIVAWSEDVPVSRDSIERLPETTVDLLMERLDELNPTRDEEEAGPLSKTSTSPSGQLREDGASRVAPVGQQS